MRVRIRIFNLLILIFLFLSGLSFFIWQRNVYSKESLKLEILGPSEAVFGEEVEYIVKYKNNGHFRLEEPELIFDPPENSLKDGEIAKREILTSEKLGFAIYPGEENSFSFRVKLYGKEGEVKIAKATLNYRPKNLKAKYTSKTTLTTKIKSVPITFEFDLPSKVEPGKKFTFNLNYFSNVEQLLENLRIQIEYPKEFEFIDSKPKAIEQSEWEVPVLNKFEGGRIEISGRIFGEEGTAKVFKGKLGILIGENLIILKTAEKGVEIVKPSIFIRQEINGNPQYVAAPGEWLHYTIFFKNIGDEEMTNLILISKLEGEAFDFQTIKTELGEARAGDNSVVFDWRKVPKLQYLAPTEEGSVEFWIRLKDEIGNVKNPVLKNKVFIGQAKEEFITKISSKVELFQFGYYYDEIFGNSGPLPPKVGESTTYTIVWEIKNYYSDLNDVKVKAKLPSFVSLTGKVFPQEMASKFSFDPESREIVWAIGNLERGKGVLSPPLTLAFQVIFSPTPEQVGTSPEIINEAKLISEDSWTGRILEASAKAITTKLTDDPMMRPEFGVVVK